MLTCSLAMFPDLQPRSEDSVLRAMRYVRLLRRYGVNRVAFWGRDPTCHRWLGPFVSQVEDIGLTRILYTGAWGGVDATQNKTFLKWAQRDWSGNPLGWQGEQRSMMLCPSSPYVPDVLSHATTLTTGKGDLLPDDKIRELFSAIMESGASPWLSIYFKESTLSRVTEIYADLLDKFNGEHLGGQVSSEE